MRQVYEHPEERRARGARAASDIRAQLSREAIGRLIHKRLAEIERAGRASTRAVQYAGSSATAGLPADTQTALQRQMDAIQSLEWSRTRDKAIPLGGVKGLGTALRVLARVLVQGRINERQQWINTEAYQQLAHLAHEAAALQANTEHTRAALEERILAADRRLGSLAAYFLRYGNLLSVAATQAPELSAYQQIVISEEIDGQPHILSGPLPEGAIFPFDRVGAWQDPSAGKQQEGVVWFHQVAHLSETGKEAIFRTISHRLRDQDLVALISHNTLDTSFDVGLLEVLYDGPVGREQRATIVRRPRLERQLVTFGYSLYLNSNDQGLVAAAIRTRGIWQQATTRWLREHLQAGAVVVDIGAHVGYFATLAARLVGESGKVVAIEPDPVNADALAMNRDQLPYPETLTVVQMAAGDLAMTAQIVRSRTDHGEHQIHLSRWAQDSRRLLSGAPLKSQRQCGVWTTSFAEKELPTSMW